MCRLMTMSDLERRDAKGQIFQVDLLNNARTVRHITTKFGRVTQMGDGRICRGQPRPYHKGRGPSAPQFWRFPSMDAYIL